MMHEKRGQDDQQANGNNHIKCSAIHALERDDMPDEQDYCRLVAELRRLILEDNQLRPGLYDQRDIELCQRDDWQVARFLLRHKLNVEAAFKMLQATLRFNNESLHSHWGPASFPRELYLHGGYFVYERDRKNNVTLYVRAAQHRRCPEVASLIHAFLTHQTMECDRQARGRGICMIFDCTGAGLDCTDMDVTRYQIWTLNNFFPRGLSYILVHNLPRILRPFLGLITKLCVDDEHRQLIRFSNSQTIFEYVARENLPDFMGGTCARDYRQVPEECTLSLVELGEWWGLDRWMALRILQRFRATMPAGVLEIAKELCECQKSGKADK